MKSKEPKNLVAMCNLERLFELHAKRLFELHA